MKKVILHISNNHSSFDDRIFFKELVSLSKYYNCYLISGGNSKNMLTSMGSNLYHQGIYNNIMVFPYPAITAKNIFLRIFRKVFREIYDYFSDWIIYYRLIKICTKNNIYPSLLHYHDLSFSKCANRLQKYFKCRMIFDCHEFYFSYFFEKKFNFSNLKKASKSLLQLKKAVLAADATISVTKNMDNIISLMNKDKEHIIVYNSSLLPIK